MKILKNKIKNQVVDFIASIGDLTLRQLNDGLIIIEDLRNVNLNIYLFLKDVIKDRIKELQS